MKNETKSRPYTLPDMCLNSTPSQCNPFPHSDVFITSDYWTAELLKYTSFDLITYTISLFFPVAIRRCICSRHDGVKRVGKTKIRTNIHAKLYIGYKGNKPTAAYIGSANAVRPTAEELLYRLPEAHLTQVVKYYNTLWNSL
jgi:hypothetical protein